jgi:hypothetical protein
MPRDLSSLFGGPLRDDRVLVAGPTQSLESLSDRDGERDFILKKIGGLARVEPKVDYSDFSNFVFFNSARDYFTITGDKILNEYPYDGSRGAVEAFRDSLDGYQRHVLSVWPKNIGHLKFDPSVSSSYVEIDDHGARGNVSRTGLLGPATGSLTLEFWCVPPPALTGSDDVMVVVQKATGSNGDGYTAFFSGSSVFFQVVSGSVTDSVSAPAVAGQNSYFAFVFDRSSDPLISIVTGSVDEFPVVAASGSSSVLERVVAGSEKLYMGSGSLAGKVVRPLTGSLDHVAIWQVPRTLNQLSQSFNVKLYAQDNLVAHWRFNEKGSISPTGSNPDPRNALVYDHSGQRIHGRIVRYFTGIRSSGSLLPYDSPDPILVLNTVEVTDYVSEQITSGTDHDRSNPNIITQFVPRDFFAMEARRNGTNVQDAVLLKNYLYIIGRFFDDLKVRIDQYTHILRNDYGSFDQTPDALLAEVGRYLGWEFVGSFLSADAAQYIVGKNVLHNTERNRELDQKLYEIKNEFWRRTLANLVHLYKSKGTRESVESFLRIHGVNRNFVKLKEYGVLPAAGISTHRIHSEKSVPALCFGTGSTSGSAYVVSPGFSSSLGSVEVRVKFPTTSSSGLVASVLTGSLWTVQLQSGSSDVYDSYAYRLSFARESVASHTGSLLLSGAHGTLELSGAGIFDNRWRNVVFQRNHGSGSLDIFVRSLSEGEIDAELSASIAASFFSGSQGIRAWVGSTGSLETECWMSEFRVWDQPLSVVEQRDHVLNFQSYGADKHTDLDSLRIHWRLNENLTTDAAGAFDAKALDVSGRGLHGSGSGFPASMSPYKKFLDEYEYIASPEYGWNEEKIRSFDSHEIRLSDSFSENGLVALEFNMVDALNEDISQILSSLDDFNTVIGLPANRYRGSYPDLDAMRSTYFKRLQGVLNFRVFSDMLEWFDRSFIVMVRRLVPDHVMFLGDEFVVESHMLERPKHEWAYRRRDVPIIPEGRITLYERT